MSQAEVIVIGAGIVGAACAWQLAQDGCQVLVLDNHSSSATAAGMGHLVCMDDSPAELALSHFSIAQWQTLAPRMPDDCAWHGCGTLWLADAPDEMALAQEKQQRLAAVGLHSELLTQAQLQQHEPLLRPGLAGGLRVPGDAILYAPNVARWLLAQGKGRITQRREEVTALEPGRIQLQQGNWLSAPVIVLATGMQATTLLPALPLRAKKGHLAITDRYPCQVQHQLVELGYAASTHASSTSVAFNIQARPTGQLLVGSSRQFDHADRQLEWDVLQQMLQRAQYFLPPLATMNIIRCWTGVRAASPDGLPLLGAHPACEGIWLAVGHEGLGVTTALGSARILSALIHNHATPIDSTPYLASRFLSSTGSVTRHRQPETESCV